MAIYDMHSKGFRGVVTRNCAGEPIHAPYKYGNGCVVIVYKNACVLKNPDGHMLVYTGQSRDTVFVEAHEYIDPKQRTLNHYFEGI